MGKKFRILSIDGGGLRGIVPVLILKELERRTGKRIHEMFDLIAGTSTGGLIAAGLTAGMSFISRDPMHTLDEILRIYTQDGPLIFPKPTTWDKLRKVWRPEFDQKGLRDKVSSLFLGTKLANCVKPVFITAYDVQNNEAVFFSSRHARQNSDLNATIYSACLATSAAPTYLPAYEVSYGGKQRTFVDGGLFMNNPTIGAITEASKYHAEAIYNRPDMAFEDICALSLGTGHYFSQNRQTAIEGGIIDWARPCVDIMMQGINQTVDYQAQELLEDGQYLRMDIRIEEEKYSDMSDSSQETRSWLMDRVHAEIICNSVEMSRLDAFIKKAELLS
jgi:patatin-like phospholipase/acyl hydrolase